MKKFLFLVGILTTAAMLNACSSTSEQANTGTTGANSSSTATANQTTQNAPANMIVVSEAEKKSREAFSNSQNADIPVVVRNPEDDKDNKYKGRIAPDDSTFQSSMNAKGQFVEMRTFNNHPQIVKIERVFVTPNEKKIFIYLKNGKTVEISDDKVQNFQATSPGNILVAAGISVDQPAPAPSADGKKTEQITAN